MITRKQNNWLTVVLLIGLIAVALTSCGNTNSPGTMVTEVYTVQPGEGVWMIAEKYLPKNTHGDRYILEFIEGIKQENYHLFDNGRVLQPGDQVKVNYWIKEKP
jgi:hypothetical protein